LVTPVVMLDRLLPVDLNYGDGAVEIFPLAKRGAAASTGAAPKITVGRMGGTQRHPAAGLGHSAPWLPTAPTGLRVQREQTNHKPELSKWLDISPPVVDVDDAVGITTAAREARPAPR
jgi:hypothetical protein